MELILGCAEFAVPGKTLAEKLEVLEARGLWLELVNDGSVMRRINEIQETLSSFKVPVKSVQAYLQHKLRTLSASAEEREAATRHLEETVKIASSLGAQNVVAVATYGEPEVDHAMQKCIDLFKRLGKLGAELGVTISIEALGRPRSSFLPSVSDVCKLVRAINMSHVRAMADTEHIHENEENVVQTLKNHLEELEEIHLRDTGSRPPGKGEINFPAVLEVLREFKGLVCLEYQPSSDPYGDLLQALKTVGLIAGAR